jgi:hypothetical protein
LLRNFASKNLSYLQGTAFWNAGKYPLLTKLSNLLEAVFLTLSEVISVVLVRSNKEFGSGLRDPNEIVCRRSVRPEVVFPVLHANQTSKVASHLDRSFP